MSSTPAQGWDERLRQTAERLRQHTLALACLVSDLPERPCVAVIDPDRQVILAASDQLADLLGVPPLELVGASIWTFNGNPTPRWRRRVAGLTEQHSGIGGVSQLVTHDQRRIAYAFDTQNIGHLQVSTGEPLEEVRRRRLRAPAAPRSRPGSNPAPPRSPRPGRAAAPSSH